jgi:hypothetical protein
MRGLLPDCCLTGLCFDYRENYGGEHTSRRGAGEMANACLALCLDVSFMQEGLRGQTVKSL